MSIKAIRCSRSIRVKLSEVRLAVVLVLVLGCGKELNPDYCYAHRTDELCVAGDAGRSDASRDGMTINSDAMMASTVYVVAATGELYAVNVMNPETMTIGTIESSPGVGYTIDALGFSGDGMLVAITENDSLLRVDPKDASVKSKVTIAASHNYIGMTVAPAGALGTDEVILAASDDDGHLWEIRTDGSVRDIGSFGNGLVVAGDIAWLPGVGLFATVKYGSCSGACPATLSTTNGDATLLATSGPSDLWALAAFEGQLWAVGGSAQAYTVDSTTGNTGGQFSTGISGVSDAAP